MLRLYTFNISHFSEKARWALDFEGVPYREHVLVPGPHMLVTRRLAPRSHVPLLVHAGRVVQESSTILDYLAERLGAGKLAPQNQSLEQAHALERELDRAFGLGVQRVLYSLLLSDRKLVTDLWSHGGPRWARAFYALAYPGVASAVSRMYATEDAARVAESRDHFRSMFDRLDAMLQTQPYLGGERPSRVDITAAALLAPLCRPPQHRLPWPTTVPEALRAFEDELRGRPTWKHVLAMYSRHRHWAGAHTELTTPPPASGMLPH
jgi:glutathione S-transferase